MDTYTIEREKWCIYIYVFVCDLIPLYRFTNGFQITNFIGLCRWPRRRTKEHKPSPRPPVTWRIRRRTLQRRPGIRWRTLQKRSKIPSQEKLRKPRSLSKPKPRPSRKAWIPRTSNNKHTVSFKLSINQIINFKKQIK